MVRTRPEGAGGDDSDDGGGGGGSGSDGADDPADTPRERAVEEDTGGGGGDGGGGGGDGGGGGGGSDSDDDSTYDPTPGTTVEEIEGPEVLEPGEEPPQDTDRGEVTDRYTVGEPPSGGSDYYDPSETGPRGGPPEVDDGTDGSTLQNVQNRPGVVEDQPAGGRASMERAPERSAGREAEPQPWTTVATGIDQGTDGLPEGLDPNAVSEAGQSAEQQFLEQNPGFTAEDVAVRLVETEEGEFRTIAELSAAGEQQVESERADAVETQLEEEYGADFVPGEDFTIGEDGQPQLTSTGERKVRLSQIQRGMYSEITAGDVVEEDGEFRLTEAAAAEERAARDEAVPESQQAAQLNTTAGEFERIRGEIETQLEAQTGADLAYGEDYVLQRTDEGFTGELTDEGTRQAAAAQTEAQYGRQSAALASVVGAASTGVRQAVSGDVDVDEISAQIRSPEEVDAATAREFSTVEVDPQTDITVEDGSPRLTDEGARSLAAQQTEARLEGQYGGDFEQGRDFTIEQTDEGYQPELTDTGQNVVTAIETGRRLEQARGAVDGSGSPATQARQAQVAQSLSADQDSFVPSPAEVRADPSQFGSDGERFGGTSAVEEYVEDVVGTVNEGWYIRQIDAEVGVDPLADVTGDVLESGSRGMVAADPMAQRYVPEEAETAREGQLASAQDVLRAPGDEQSATTRAEKVGEGAVGGVGRLVTGVPELSIEAGEYAVAGGSAVATGDVGDFVDESAEAGAEQAVAFGEQLADQPYRTGAGVIATLPASTGIIRGAQIVGGARAGRAASFAIQPGEELAISAARVGVVSGRTASRVPGVPRSIRGGGEGDARPDAEAEASRSSVRERLPDVDVNVGSGAASGRFEVNLNADLQGRLMGAERSAAELPDRFRSLVEAPEGGFLADTSTGRVQPAALTQPAATIARRARSSVGRVASEAADVPGRVRTGARNVGVELEAGYYRAADRVPSGDEAAMNFERFQRDRPATLRPNLGYVADADASIASRVRDRIPSGEGAAMNFERFQRDRPATLQPNVGYVYDADSSLSARVRDRIPARSDLAMEIRRTRRDVSLPSIAGVRGRIEGEGERSFWFDESTERVQPPGPGDAVDAGRAAGARAAEAAASVRDFGVRVDVGRPGRTRATSDMTVDEVGVRFEGDTDADQPLPYEPGEGDVDGPPTDQLPAEFREPDTGGGSAEADAPPVQQTTQREVFEIDARTGETEADGYRARMEPDTVTTGVEEPTATEPSFEAQEPSVDPIGAREFGFEDAAALDARADIRPDLRADPTQEPGLAVGQEPTQEPVQEPIQEPMQEPVMEPMEPNPEPRPEPFGESGGPPDDDGFDTMWEEESETFRTGFATAEELEQAFEDAARR